MTWVPATPMDEYAKGVQECRGALYVRPQGGDKLRPYEGIFTAKNRVVAPLLRRGRIDREEDEKEGNGF